MLPLVQKPAPKLTGQTHCTTDIQFLSLKVNLTVTSVDWHLTLRFWFSFYLISDPFMAKQLPELPAAWADTHLKPTHSSRYPTPGECHCSQGRRKPRYPQDCMFLCQSALPCEKTSPNFRFVSHSSSAHCTRVTYLFPWSKNQAWLLNICY